MLLLCERHLSAVAPAVHVLSYTLCVHVKLMVEQYLWESEAD